MTLSGVINPRPEDTCKTETRGAKQVISRSYDEFTESVNIVKMMHRNNEHSKLTMMIMLTVIVIVLHYRNKQTIILGGQVIHVYNAYVIEATVLLWT